MAEVVGPLLIKGSMGDISVYYNSRLKKWIARKKGGADKNKIKKSRVFARTRENNSEFTACNRWCHLFRIALEELDHLNYGYYMGDVVQMAKNIQLLDKTGHRGHRDIVPSMHKSLLTEINFNVEHPFKQVLLRRPEIVTDEKRQSVTVSFPQFYPNGELNWRKSYSFYRFTLTVAPISDYVWLKQQKKYAETHPELQKKRVTTYSNWLRPGTETIDLSLTVAFADQDIAPSDATVMVGLGIEFASELSNHTVSWTKGDGTMAIIESL